MRLRQQLVRRIRRQRTRERERLAHTSVYDLPDETLLRILGFKDPSNVSDAQLQAIIDSPASQTVISGR
jgi:hypothetical protein